MDLSCTILIQCQHFPFCVKSRDPAFFVPKVLLEHIPSMKLIDQTLLEKIPVETEVMNTSQDIQCSTWHSHIEQGKNRQSLWCPTRQCTMRNTVTIKWSLISMNNIYTFASVHKNQRPNGLYSSALQYSATVAYVLLKSRPGSEGMNP